MPSDSSSHLLSHILFSVYFANSDDPFHDSLALNLATLDLPLVHPTRTTSTTSVFLSSMNVLTYAGPHIDIFRTYLRYLYSLFILTRSGSSLFLLTSTISCVLRSLCLLDVSCSIRFESQQVID